MSGPLVDLSIRARRLPAAPVVLSPWRFETHYQNSYASSKGLRIRIISFARNYAMPHHWHSVLFRWPSRNRFATTLLRTLLRIDARMRTPPGLDPYRATGSVAASQQSRHPSLSFGICCGQPFDRSSRASARRELSPACLEGVARQLQCAGRRRARLCFQRPTDPVETSGRASVAARVSNACPAGSSRHEISRP